MTDKGRFQPDLNESNDCLATDEAAAWAGNRNLEGDEKAQEHGRHQRFQNHANWVALGLLWCVAAFTLIGMTIYIFHLLAPEAWRWLDTDALDKIRTLLTGVLFSSAISGYVNKRMS